MSNADCKKRAMETGPYQSQSKVVILSVHFFFLYFHPFSMKYSRSWVHERFIIYMLIWRRRNKIILSNMVRGNSYNVLHKEKSLSNCWGHVYSHIISSWGFLSQSSQPHHQQSKILLQRSTHFHIQPPSLIWLFDL